VREREKERESKGDGEKKPKKVCWRKLSCSLYWWATGLYPSWPKSQEGSSKGEQLPGEIFFKRCMDTISSPCTELTRWCKNYLIEFYEERREKGWIWTSAIQCYHGLASSPLIHVEFYYLWISRVSCGHGDLWPWSSLYMDNHWCNIFPNLLFFTFNFLKLTHQTWRPTSSMNLKFQNKVLKVFTAMIFTSWYQWIAGWSAPVWPGTFLRKNINIIKD
jgi:hypothetical protein